MLKYYFDKISRDPDIIPPAAFFDLYQLFSINQDKFQCFSQLMNTQWGGRWSSQADFRRKAQELLLDNICKQHSDAFKHTLNETFPQIQQSNIQSLSFFIPQETSNDLSYANTDVSLFP
jgi:hypothetical protein